jgi:hypothetical protein
LGCCFHGAAGGTLDDALNWECTWLVCAYFFIIFSFKNYETVEIIFEGRCRCSWDAPRVIGWEC